MKKFNICLMLGLFAGLVITYKLAASVTPGRVPRQAIALKRTMKEVPGEQESTKKGHEWPGAGFVPINNGLMVGIQGGMTNTLADHGRKPDIGTLGVHIAYLGAYKKSPIAKHYSYFKAGLDYELAFGPRAASGSALHGLGLFADAGAVLFDMWRIGAGIEANYLTKKDLAAGLITGWTLNPYLETAIMWQAFKTGGFDFGFRLGAPVRITAQTIEPYYKINSLNQLDWKFTLSYFHFFEGGK